MLAHDFTTLIGAFIVGGLREVGEPARKAMIVDLVRPSLRARSIGLYYLVRSLTIAPAAFIGSLLWNVMPALPFGMAGAIGVVGVIVFAATVEGVGELTTGRVASGNMARVGLLPELPFTFDRCAYPSDPLSAPGARPSVSLVRGLGQCQTISARIWKLTCYAG